LVDNVETDGATPARRPDVGSLLTGQKHNAHSSSIFGWKILFMNPMLGDLNGYWSGSSTWIFQTPPANGAEQLLMRTTYCGGHQEQDKDVLSVGP